MNVEKIILNIAEHLGKRKGDVKRVYNTIKKTKDEELSGGVPEEMLERIVLLGVLRKYEIDVNTLDSFSEEEEEEEEDDDEDFDDEEDDDDDLDITFEEVKPEVATKGKVANTTWKNFLNSIPEPKESTDYETVPNLVQISGALYTLKLTEPDELPYEYEGVGHDGDPYVSYAMDVKLLGISPKSFKNETYDKSNEKSGVVKGEKCFNIGETYKLWLSKTAIGWFAKFWRDNLGLETADDRKFTYQKFKKEKITKYYFKEA